MDDPDIATLRARFEQLNRTTYQPSDPPHLIKHNLLKRTLDNVNTDLYMAILNYPVGPNHSDPTAQQLKEYEQNIDNIINERYTCMATFLQKPSNCNNYEFITKCADNVEGSVYFQPWTDLIATEEVYPIGFVRSETSPLKIYCVDKASMIRSMTAPVLYYTDDKHENFAATYRLPNPLADIWITNDALITLLLSNSIVFKLAPLETRTLGILHTVSSMFGQKVLLYSVNEAPSVIR